MCSKLVVVPNPFGLVAQDFEIDRYEIKRLRRMAADGCYFLYETAEPEGLRLPSLEELGCCADVAVHFVLKGRNPDSFRLQQLLQYRRAVLERLATRPEVLAAYRLIYQRQGARLSKNQTGLDAALYLAGQLYVQAVYQISVALRVASLYYYRLGLPHAIRLLLIRYETEDHLSGENRGASEKLSSLENLAFVPAEQQFKLRCDNGYAALQRQHEHDPLFAFHNSGALFVGLPGRSYDFDFTSLTRVRESYPHRRLPMTLLQHNSDFIKLQYFDRKGIQRKLTLSYLYRAGHSLHPTDSALGRLEPDVDLSLEDVININASLNGALLRAVESMDGVARRVLSAQRIDVGAADFGNRRL